MLSCHFGFGVVVDVTFRSKAEERPSQAEAVLNLTTLLARTDSILMVAIRAGKETPRPDSIFIKSHSMREAALSILTMDNGLAMVLLIAMALSNAMERQDHPWMLSVVREVELLNPTTVQTTLLVSEMALRKKLECRSLVLPKTS